MRSPRFLDLAVCVLATAAPLQAQQFGRPPTSDADALADQVRILAVSPNDLEALIRAGDLALRLDDDTAAASFFTRAEHIDANNARVKAGEGSLLVQAERPGEALRRFGDAQRLGLDPSAFAADRGLAYDLIGQPDRAQRDYRLALRRAPNDETTRRYALSLAIGGRRDEGLQLIDPLLRRSDRGAWRARAFILAMGGDQGGAARIATSMLPPGLAGQLQPFFVRLPSLGPADRAFAVHFGELRATPERIADARLIPPLPVLAPDPSAPPLQVAAVAPPPVVDRRADRRRRERDRERGRVVEMASQSAELPLPPPPSYSTAASYAPPASYVAAEPYVPAAVAPYRPSARPVAPVPAYRPPSPVIVRAPEIASALPGRQPGFTGVPVVPGSLGTAAALPSNLAPARPPTVGLVSAASTGLPASRRDTPVTGALPRPPAGSVVTTSGSAAAVVAAPTPGFVDAGLAPRSSPAPSPPEPFAPTAGAIAVLPAGGVTVAPGAAQRGPSVAAPPAVVVASAARAPTSDFVEGDTPLRSSAMPSPPPSPPAASAVAARPEPTAAAVPGATQSGPVVAAPPAAIVTSAASAVTAGEPNLPAAPAPSPDAAGLPARGQSAPIVAAPPIGLVAEAPVNPSTSGDVDAAEGAPLAPEPANAVPTASVRSESAILSSIISGIGVPGAELGVAPIPRAVPAPAPAPPAASTIAQPTPATAVGARTPPVESRTAAASTAGRHSAGARENDAAPPRPRATGSDRRGQAAEPPAPTGAIRNGRAVRGSDPPADTAPFARSGRAGRGVVAGDIALDRRQTAAEARAARNDPARLYPSRIWVQVAGGASERDLIRAWADARGKAPAAFRGRQGWTTPLRATNRVLAGPFDSQAAAQTFVNQIARAGISGFIFTSSAGQQIDRLPAS